MASFPFIGVAPGWREDSLFLKPFYLRAMREAGAVPLALPLPDSASMPGAAALSSLLANAPLPFSSAPSPGNMRSFLRDALPSFWGEAQRLASRLDGLLLTGGPDLHPLFFGEEVLSGCGGGSLLRDLAEFCFFHAFFLQKKPILGICRGAQLINTALGGTLLQDISLEVPGSRLCHSQPFSPELVSHRIYIAPESRLEDILKDSGDIISPGYPSRSGRPSHSGHSSRPGGFSPGQKDISAPTAPCSHGPFSPGNSPSPETAFTGKSLFVNSFHHQAVRVPGAGLSACAFASDGIIEAVEHARYPFLLGVQWHPERLLCREGSSCRRPPHAFALFSAFCRAC